MNPTWNSMTAIAARIADPIRFSARYTREPVETAPR
jgi:hypothetical protein